MVTKKAAKKSAVKPAKKTSVKKSASASAGRKRHSISVQATVLMRAELEIEAADYDEALEQAQELCDDGGIAFDDFRIVEFVDGPDVLG